MPDDIPPFTPEQIAWLDARYRKSVSQLERMLEEQGKEPPRGEEYPDE